MPEPLLEEQRENWVSRTGFVLAAIGSAVGLGNLWGFPYKLYSYGGGAFLIPYILGMVLIGIPLLIAEFSLGHLTQRATPDAFGRANRKFAFVGWWQIILSFIIVTYYAVILAWCVSFLYYSVVGIFQGGELPWAGKGLEGVRRAHSFFFDRYLGSPDGLSLGRLQGHILLALAITWLAMYLCIFRGIRLVSRVVMWTVPLPWLMLLILTLRGLTLEGATQGLEFYLEPNWSRLADPETWRWGFGQMFFSMSLAFGIMITYASFLHRKSDLNNNAAIIGLADMGTSFVAGLAVFSTLGGMAFASTMAGNPVPVEQVAKTGPSLAFVAFPYALAQLPHSAWFSVLFFGSLLLLGIDSAFSITESVLASIVDKTNWSRDKTLLGVTLVGLGIGVLFCTANGLNWLGTIDDFINGTWGITLTALLECLLLGWLFRLKRLRDHANERSDWKVGILWEGSLRLVIPVVLAGLFAWSLFEAVAQPRGYVSHYAAGTVSVDIPAQEGEQFPSRAVLQLQFVTRYNDAVEHEFTLDPADPDNADAWRLLGAEQPTTLPQEFAAEQIMGRPIRFTTDALTPRTAYLVRYRWASRPRRDPKSGLPMPVPEEDQADWRPVTRLTTPSERVGTNVANTAGLMLMAFAPVAAVVIAGLRFDRVDVKVIDTHYEVHRPTGRILGTLLILLALAGLVGLITAFGWMLREAHCLRAGREIPLHPGGLTARALVLYSGAAALLSLLIGAFSVWTLERRLIRASMLLRLAGGGGVLATGLAVGQLLAAWKLHSQFAVAPMTYDNELSGASYLILGGMLALIVVGLLACFVLAIRAAGESAPAEEQLPDSEEMN